MNYIVQIEKYNVDLTNLTEIKIVGGEPTEKKHDEFVDKLKGMPIIHIRNDIILTNCTMLPGKQVQESPETL